MIKFDIKNSLTGEVQFTAEIDCGEYESTSVKMGLAVKWAINRDANLGGANLSGADLGGADLSDADLSDVNLRGADLSDADLVGANLRGANLVGANLGGANLRDANLVGANLRYANLGGANLGDANLVGANLVGANLSGANLVGANLSGANLGYANLNGVTGINNWIKCIQIEDWPITYTSDVMQIGCQRHLLTEWAEFSDAQIRAMDGTRALNFWRKNKDWLFKTIEMFPAQPMKVDAPAEQGDTA